MNTKIAIVFIILFSFAVPLKAQLAAVKDAEIQKSNDIKEQERELLANLYKMSSRQRSLAQQKAQQLEKREELEADVAELQKEIHDVGEQINQVRKKIILRIKNLHRVSAPTIFQSLFGAQDITEMDRNARIMYKISKADVEQLRVFRGLKNLLNQQQNSLEKKIAEFEKTQKKLEKQESAIKSTYMAQMEMLRKLNDKDKTILNKLKEIKRKTFDQVAKKQTAFEGLFESGIYEKKGSLDLPATGVVSRRFGLLRLASKKIRIYNKGWFISTAPQKEVNSIYKGQVVYTGELEEHNKVVIVDHGDHFYSVYANLADILIQAGAEVESQAVLGRVDESRHYGHGLYFELRHFSQSEDPAEWFKNSGLNISSVKEQSI